MMAVRPTWTTGRGTMRYTEEQAKFCDFAEDAAEKLCRSGELVPKSFPIVAMALEQALLQGLISISKPE